MHRWKEQSIPAPRSEIWVVNIPFEVCHFSCESGRSEEYSSGFVTSWKCALLVISGWVGDDSTYPSHHDKASG